MLYTSIWYVDLTSSQYRQTNLVSTSNANIESTCDRVYEIDIESRSFRCHFYKVDSTLNSTSTIESRSYRPWNDIESMLLVTRVVPSYSPEYIIHSVPHYLSSERTKVVTPWKWCLQKPPRLPTANRHHRPETNTHHPWTWLSTYRR